MTYRALTDQELTEKLNRMDNAAFAEIYERYWALLYQHARKMLRDNQQAEDVVQDVFTTLLHKKGALQLHSTLSAYLYSITRNSVINLVRRKQVRMDYLQYLEHRPESEGFQSDRALLEKELADRIESEIQALPPKMREVFEMSRKAYMSNAEIARERNVSEGTVKKQLYYAIRVLRGKLSAFFFLELMIAILWLNRFFN